ncbi:hypothetical protein SteCoe_10853 [Stentor coeruleus]|uniref:RING-type domain-containing protein n=1 Tax=Stentor coeruleus TaxID=5963 RepID=A0A1R2CEQ0_9CILI|nr:hypothetical protein SteCoe_10853 [Stentor coeruleus]
MSQEIIEVMEPEQDDISQNWCNMSEAGNLKEGYDMERFTEPPRKDFQCPICLGVVRNPLECSQCGILLCKKCACSCSKPQNPFFIMTSSVPKFNCPICRSRAAPREPSSILKKIINSSVVYCKNKSHGCPVSEALGEIKNHEKECKFKAIRCANHGFCDKQGNKIDFISVEFSKIGKGSYPTKSKLVCSDICRKVVIMDHLLKTDQSEKAINEYRMALEPLDKLS